MDSKNSKKSKNQSKDEPKTKSSSKFWILFGLFIVLPAIFIARSPLFTLNLNKLLNANYIELPERIPLEGNLSPNNKLQKATYIGHKKIRGPETFAIDKDGSIYTGLMNGQIIKVNEDGTFKKIIRIGDEQNETKCNDFDESFHSNARCGRPLGIRIKENTSFLYVADSYIGIVKVDLSTGSKKVLLRSNDKRLGFPAKLVNDLDLDGDLIYFIDSSFERGVHEAIEEHVEALPNGRLFCYNEKTDQLEFLLDNLFFPNGLQLTPDKESVLINENTMSRIIRFYLKGEKKGIREIFADIPGFGDTIRLTDHQTLLVPFATVRHSVIGVHDLLGKYPTIRKILGLILNMRYMFLIFPKYGLIAEYDLNGNPLRSWHDPTGKVVGCTTAGLIHNNKLYIGSFYNDFIAVVDYN